MKRSKAVNLAIVPLLAAAFSACGNSQEEEVAYCVDKDDKVVENRYCDENNGGGGLGGFFFFYGAGGFGRGDRVPAGGERINAADRAAVAARGGFGSSASPSGVGRPTGRAVGGGSLSSGG